MEAPKPYFLPRRASKAVARPTPNSVMDAGSGTATGTANAGLAAIDRMRIAKVLRIKTSPLGNTPSTAGRMRIRDRQIARNRNKQNLYQTDMSLKSFARDFALVSKCKNHRHCSAVADCSIGLRCRTREISRTELARDRSAFDFMVNGSRASRGESRELSQNEKPRHKGSRFGKFRLMIGDGRVILAQRGNP